MTHRQDIEHHRNSLGEIRDIMYSMKTLAYLETRKLDRFLVAQHAVVDSIETVAADFLGFHADTLPYSAETIPVYVIIGTERGFCGDFNQRLVRHYQSIPENTNSNQPIVIAIGRKLHTLLENEAISATYIDGAGVVEEVTIVLSQLAQELASLQEQYGVLSLYALYHSVNDDDDGVVMQKLLPPFQNLLHQPSGHSHPPVLHVSPAQFLIELTDQYLFAALHAMLYASLMAENHQRVTHLDGAVKHLDDEVETLKRQYNILRQEEIIEEIEIILLSTSSLDDPWSNPASSRKSTSTGD